jgi:hypothetical protein
MPVLRFVCPATGNQVETDIDLDAQGFADLPRDATTLACPHCDRPHLLAGLGSETSSLNTSNRGSSRVMRGPATAWLQCGPRLNAQQVHVEASLAE